jgi:hypothetical protein
MAMILRLFMTTDPYLHLVHNVHQEELRGPKRNEECWEQETSKGNKA